jgi:hypothetical protein
MQAIPESVRRAVEVWTICSRRAVRTKPQNDLNTIEHNFCKKGGIEERAKLLIKIELTGAPGMTRTCDLLVRSC